MVGPGKAAQACLLRPPGGRQLLFVGAAQLGLRHQGEIHTGSFRSETNHHPVRIRMRSGRALRSCEAGAGSMSGMTPRTAVVVAALLLAIFLVVIAAMVWQEAKRRSTTGGLIYAIDDAVDFVLKDLDPAARARLGRAGVRRILEWEVYYLQGLADGRRVREAEVIAGGHGPVVEYIGEQITRRHGVTYDVADIREVLAGEARYLEAIGAVGEPVEDLA